MYRRTVLIGMKTLLAGCMAIATSANAQVRDKVRFTSPENPSWRIELEGYFTKPQAAAPGDEVFAYVYSTSNAAGTLYYLYEYDFAGRTGDKTFELRLIKREGSSPRSETKISAYFDAETAMPLNAIVIPRLGANCSKSELPKLKMISLSGNQLEAQVLLPDCLKR